MCGRLTQVIDGIRVVIEMGYTQHPQLRLDLVPRYNVPPGSRVAALHRLDDDGEPRVEELFWNYQPAWAASKGRAYPNARIEKVSSSAFYKDAWQNARRVIVPASGWYEWLLQPDGSKQPYYIVPRDGGPLYLAGITLWQPGQPSDAPARGMAIITADAEGGMVDIHDRRPVVLAASDAALWLDRMAPLPLAAELISRHRRPSEDFEWWPVSRAVGNVRNTAATLIHPIAL